MATALLVDAIERRPANPTTDREQILQKLLVWDFGNPNADPGFTFVDKLADKTGWDRDYTERVVPELGRFIGLWVYFPEAKLVPSPAIDEAWHLAILFTRRYAKMCQHTFGAFMHHNPSTSATEKVKLRDNYGETLQHYEEIFGEQPPTDIWPNRRQEPQAYGENCCNMLDDDDRCDGARCDVIGYPEEDDE